VLAEGNFRVADFYYLRAAYRAAGARLMELTTRYPLYSQADQANWMLGQIYEKTEHNDIAAKYYARIVKDYPISPLVGDAKNKLVKFGVPVPPADPAAVARMQQEQNAPRPGLIKRSMGVLKNSPDYSAAARSGDPTMTPASESGDETIGFSLQPNVPAVATGSSVGSSATVETITPGSASALPAPPADPRLSSTGGSTGASTTDSTAPTTDSTATTPAATTAPPANSNQESTSKKKGGLRKLIPF
jgi:hypothetical protein